VLRFLLDNGGDPNVATLTGLTPLNGAALRGDVEAIRLLIDNPYVFGPFWEFQRGEIGEADYRDRFNASRNAAMAAIGRMDTTVVLTVVFDRLYTLRNQLIHGGATWNGSVNRSQVRDGSRIMAHLVPTIIHLMMNNPDALWGDAAYPVVPPA
jgi:ankyrin repeat protein